MADINSVVITGRLTKDVEVSYSKNTNTPIGKFSVAVNRRVKDGEQWADKASFFDITFIGKSVDGIKPYLTKGRQVGIEGTLEQDTWEKDGKRNSKVVIIARNVQLLGGGSKESSGESKGQSAPHEQNTNGFSEDIPYDEPPAF